MRLGTSGRLRYPDDASRRFVRDVTRKSSHIRRSPIKRERKKGLAYNTKQSKLKIKVSTIWKESVVVLICCALTYIPSEPPQ